MQIAKLNENDEIVYVLEKCCGFDAVTKSWLTNLPEENIVSTYDELINDPENVYIASDEQVEFNLANPGLPIYNAFYMEDYTDTEKNEKIRKERAGHYKAEADPLLMTYLHYLYTDQTEKAEEAKTAWLAAIEAVQEEYPYETTEEEEEETSDDQE